MVPAESLLVIDTDWLIRLLIGLFASGVFAWAWWRNAPVLHLRSICIAVIVSFGIVLLSSVLPFLVFLVIVMMGSHKPTFDETTIVAGIFLHPFTVVIATAFITPMVSSLVEIAFYRDTEGSSQEELNE
jgi:hypothetical protein